jgi:AmiR/NasT family two-component response regulator
MSEPVVPDSRQRRAGFAPVIEQAKGIIMARYRCGPEEAFEILCGMSQYANVKLRILAERLVRQVSTPASGNDLAHLG